MTLGRYVHVPARSAPSERPPTQPAHSLRHNLRSQPPPTSRSPSPRSVILRLEIGSRGSAGTRRWASTSPAGTLRDPRRPPGGRHRPISTDTATLPSARREVVKRGCRAPGGPPSGPTAPSTPPSRLRHSSSTRGVLPVPFPRPLAYGREHAAYSDSLPPPP